MDISQIIEHVGGIQPFSVVVTSKDIGENAPWVQDSISVTGQIVNVGTVFRLTGTVTASANLECCRCLQVFERAVSFEFEEEFDGLAFGYPDDWIDIAEPIRAALIFQEPMQPFCNDDCKGLCPHCGVDRNRTDCGCDKEIIDPRLASLQQLLKQ